MPDPESYEVFAIRYGRHDRPARDNFLGGDPHDGPMPLDYFVWAIRNEKRTFVLDTGFNTEAAKQRGREHLRCPGDGLKAIGIDPAGVEDVIISHMHYDHAGNHDLFPNARFHLQDSEMAYCTGRCMRHATLSHSFSPEDVVAMVRRVFAGRVQFHDGSDELAPGITLHRVGGHTKGLQVARVMTKRGWVVLAADASHLYANMAQGRPFPVVHDVAEVLEGFDTLKRLASSPDHIVPGHDPLVMERYPAARPDLAGIAARLDVAPTMEGSR
jgi:glyoxylase-like metal-dependent hydrolase (beta-lactamase superfamily II)